MSRERSAARNRFEFALYRAVRAGAGALGPRALAALGSRASTRPEGAPSQAR